MRSQIAAGFAFAFSLVAPAYAQKFDVSGFSAKERSAFMPPAHAGKKWQSES